MQCVRRFLEDETGSTAIEYGLIAALICIVIIGGITSVGTSVGTTWNSVSDEMG